jgi:membrane-associated phospholipid phosphatase
MDIAHERCLSSFPSSHTGLAILIALNIWPYIGSGMRIFSAFIIGLVALSRVGLAMHYPADIFYSIFIAILVFAISKLVYRLFEDNLIKWVKEYIIK